MGTEIERKFLLINDDWRGPKGKLYRQGYLHIGPQKVIRVRVVESTGYLTIKSKVSDLTRQEYEYEIPVDEANELLNKLCDKPLIEKTRYRIPYKGMIWEIDEFFGDNASLILAEIELEDESQSFSVPSWLGEEVSADERYYNAYLSQHPYNTWKNEA